MRIAPTFGENSNEKTVFCKKIIAKPFAFKNKVLSLHSLIVSNDVIVMGYTNLVILSIYLKHRENTHNADIIRYCKTVKHLVGNAESCGKNAPPFFYLITRRNSSLFKTVDILCLSFKFFLTLYPAGNARQLYR